MPRKLKAALPGDRINLFQFAQEVCGNEANDILRIDIDIDKIMRQNYNEIIAKTFCCKGDFR